MANCAGPPKTTACGIVNVDTAQCMPSDPLEDEYDMHIKDMMGYIYWSPEDIGAVKKYLKKILGNNEYRTPF